MLTIVLSLVIILKIVRTLSIGAFINMNSRSSVVIKKYANRRLYNTSTSSYVTLNSLSEMIKDGTEFNVYDAKSNEDITHSVLAQIMVEEESKPGQNLLPSSFLRHLISFYGDSMQWIVPNYLEQSLQLLIKNQEQIRDYMRSFGSVMPFNSVFEQMSKQNMSIFESAIKLFDPGLQSTDANAFSPFNMMMYVAQSQRPVNTAGSGNSTAAASRTSNKPSYSTPSVAQSHSVAVQQPSAFKPPKGQSIVSGHKEEIDHKSLHADLYNKPTPKAESKADSEPTAVEVAAKPASESADVTKLKKKLQEIPTQIPTPETKKVVVQNQVSGADIQNKIAALQKQLADLARNKA